MSFNQSVILEYSPELLELLQEWEKAKTDIDYTIHDNTVIQVYYNDKSLIFLLGRAYQLKLVKAEFFNTKD